tara:strand:+ start:60 stop:611 length:552 start_codon:yes stop_codon:yes gene_type:complete
MPGANPSLEDRFYNAKRFLPAFIGGRSWEPADIGNDAVKQMIGRKGFRKGWSPAHERQWQSDHAFSDEPIETQQLMKDLGVTDYVGAPVASPYTGIMSNATSHPQWQPYGSQQQPQMNPAFGAPYAKEAAQFGFGLDRQQMMDMMQSPFRAVPPPAPVMQQPMRQPIFGSPGGAREYFNENWM